MFSALPNREGDQQKGKFAEQDQIVCNLWTYFHQVCCSLQQFTTLCASCIDPERIEDASSEGGYATPRSLETPVQMASKCSSLNHTIRDPYATGYTSRSSCHQQLRQSASVDQDKYPVTRANRPSTATATTTASSTSNGGGSESIYTILIRFPPSKSNGSMSASKDSFVEPAAAIKSSTVSRVPSIQMIPAAPSSTTTTTLFHSSSAVTDDDDDDNGEISASSKLYPRSLPITRRFMEGSSSERIRHQSGAMLARQTTSSSCPARPNPITSASPGSMQRRKANEISRLPLDTKLVPKQLVRGAQQSVDTPTGSVDHSTTTTTKKVTGVTTVAGGGITSTAGKKKASSEKKQDRKAAKTLSAILLAFIVTWTPYSVLVIINAILGKDQADDLIPEIIWQFSYYLCYINSTVNPVLYALCNAAFRRTYVRILTCRWGSRARQPVNRGYYYG